MSLLAALLLGCTITATRAGPTYWGETRERARLEEIARRPTDAGTEEAVQQWADHPDWEVAKSAVFAAMPDVAGPLEERFAKLSVDQQREVLAYAGTIPGDASSGLVLRLSASGGLVDEGIAALAGKQDAAAVQGLLDLAGSAPAEITRVAAVRGLEPPGTPLARDGLLALIAGQHPPSVRGAAVDVLAPYDDPVVRLALMSLATAEDSEVAALALDRFDAPRADSEFTAGLAATDKLASGAAAVRFLDRATALPQPVLARFQAIADTFVEPARGATRFEAAAALLRRGDANGGPAMVQLLDLDPQRAPAEAVLDAWTLGALPALRANVAALTTPNGKAEAARLLARFGGPLDEPLIAAAASPVERDGLVASLARAPYGLFPEGKVRYSPALDGLDAPVEHTLADAIALGKKTRTDLADPVRAYLGAARAWLAGARSREDTRLLDEAAKTARASVVLWADNRLDTDATGLSDDIGARAGTAVGASTGLSLRWDTRPSKAIPGLVVSGDLSCKVVPSVERETLPPYQYHYTVLVTNPRKEELRYAVESYPWDKRTISECTMTCYCYVQNEGTRTTTHSCDASTPSVGACNCNSETTTSDNPDYTALVSEYNSEPELMEQQLQVPRERVRVIDVTTERCEGPLSLTVGASKHEGQLRYEAQNRTWLVHSEARPYHPDGTALPVVTSQDEPGARDDRPAALDQSVGAAVAGFRPTLTDVRAMYAAAVSPAVVKGDARGARDTLVGSDPSLIGTDAASLDAFRTVFFADGAGAFPAAWK